VLKLFSKDHFQKKHFFYGSTAQRKLFRPFSTFLWTPFFKPPSRTNLAFCPFSFPFFFFIARFHRPFLVIFSSTYFPLGRNGNGDGCRLFLADGTWSYPQHPPHLRLSPDSIVVLSPSFFQCTFSLFWGSVLVAEGSQFAVGFQLSGICGPLIFHVTHVLFSPPHAPRWLPFLFPLYSAFSPGFLFFTSLKALHNGVLSVPDSAYLGYGMKGTH